MLKQARADIRHVCGSADFLTTSSGSMSLVPGPPNPLVSPRHSHNASSGSLGYTGTGGRGHNLAPSGYYSLS